MAPSDAGRRWASCVLVVGVRTVDEAALVVGVVLVAKGWSLASVGQVLAAVTNFIAGWMAGSSLGTPAGRSESMKNCVLDRSGRPLPS